MSPAFQEQLRIVRRWPDDGVSAAPRPWERLLAALGDDLAICVVEAAGTVGVRLEHVEVALEPGDPRGVRVALTVAGRGAEGTLREIAARAFSRSSVRAALEEGVPIEPRIAVD